MNVGLCFYFGKLPPLAKLSLQLIGPQLDSVHLFSDDESVASAGNIRVHPMTAQELNQRVSDLIHEPFHLVSPYKLCDLRPLWPLLAGMHWAETDLVCWFDLDCLWGDLPRHLPQPGRVRPLAVGKRGHFSGLTFALASRMVNVLDDYFGRTSWTRLVAAPRHYAFDEFRYWHRLLSMLVDDGALVWDAAVSDRAVDVGYWSARPVCVNRHLPIEAIALRPDSQQKYRVWAEFNRRAIEVPYVHIQKRPVDCAAFVDGATHELSFRANGDAVVSTRPGEFADRFKDSSWRANMFLARLAAKMTIEAFPWQHQSF